MLLLGAHADVSAITDAARGKKFSSFLMVLALLRNYDSFQVRGSLALPLEKVSRILKELG